MQYYHHFQPSLPPPSPPPFAYLRNWSPLYPNILNFTNVPHVHTFIMLDFPDNICSSIEVYQSIRPLRVNVTYFSTSNMEMLVPPQTRQDLCYITWCLSLKGCPTNEMHVVQLNKGKTSISTSSKLLYIVNLFLVLPIDP